MSNKGRVRSVDRYITYINGNVALTKGVILSCFKKKNGYISVDLYGADKKRSKHHVHRLVAEAFIENIHDKPCIDHINTIRDDNCVENLKWCTYSEKLNNKNTKVKMAEARKNYIPSEETKEIFSKMYSGGGNPTAKKVICDGIIYDCIKDFANTTEYAYTTVLGWLNPKSNKKPPQKYIDLGLKYI